MIDPKIPLARPFLTETELEAVGMTFKSGWVAQGSQVKEFEDRVAAYSGAKYGIATNSCTSGLYQSLRALGISGGDKVIVPDFTFWSTGRVVKYVGAEPVVVDIDPLSYCIDVDKVAEAIDDDVKAIIPVHVFGHPADMFKFEKISKEYNLPIIADAASALGSEISGCWIGSFDNFTCFSFQGRKIVTTGEGGMIVLNDPVMAGELRAQVKARSLRMSDIQAAIGLVQMDRIEAFIKRRIDNAKLYGDLIQDRSLAVDIPRVSSRYRHTYQAYVVLVDNRDKVIKYLKLKGIESTIGTYSLTSDPSFRGDCPNGKIAFESSLALPMYHELTRAQIYRVVDALEKALK